MGALTQQNSPGVRWDSRFLTAVGDVGIQGRRDKILLALLEEVCQDIYQQTNTDKTSES